MSDLNSAEEIFDEMLNRIGLVAAIELQASVGAKFQETINTGEPTVLTPVEVAFLQIWMNFMIEATMKDFLIVEVGDEDITEIGAPGRR